LLRLRTPQNAAKASKNRVKKKNMAQHDRKYLRRLAGLLETFSLDLRLYE
jgi:hypothetical protein